MKPQNQLLKHLVTLFVKALMILATAFEARATIIEVNTSPFCQDIAGFRCEGRPFADIEDVLLTPDNPTLQINYRFESGTALSLINLDANSENIGLSHRLFNPNADAVTMIHGYGFLDRQGNIIPASYRAAYSIFITIESQKQILGISSSSNLGSLLPTTTYGFASFVTLTEGTSLTVDRANGFMIGRLGTNSEVVRV